MRVRPSTLLVLSLVPIALCPVHLRAAELATAPHFLKLTDRERIVLFSDGPVAGALADHGADGRIVVTVPRVAAGTAIVGREFDAAAAAGTGTRVRVTTSPQGDARIEITPAVPVARVHAYGTAKPSRLTIDLLREGAPSDRPAAKAVSAKVGGAAVAPAKVEGTAVAPAKAEGTAVAAAKAEGTAVAPPEVAGHAVAPASTAPAHVPPPPSHAAEGHVANTPAAGAPAPDAPDPRVPDAQAPGARAQAGPMVARRGAPPVAGRSDDAVAAAMPSAPRAAAPAAASPPATSAPATLVCRWRRIAGIPYCAPDPKAGTYAADLGTAEVAGLLDRARSGPTLAPLASHGPAEAHLNADIALVRAAKSGYLVPALGEYEHALRAYPAFPDASRSRANVALIYHSLGFAPELARLARAKNDPVAPFAAVLLADLWRDGGERRDVAPLLAMGRSAGGITTCLAERVAAHTAADEARADAFPGAFADLSRVCPRTILEDSVTAWLRGRAMVLGGEASRAAESLPALEVDLPRRERPRLLADVITAQDAAGDAKAARRTEERLAGGTLGRRAARKARLALAARDAAEGKLGDLSGRFADLPMEDALVTRARADAIAVGELLRTGNEIAALGAMTERKVEARSLAPADQLLLVRALRKVGLLDQARRVLAGIGAATTGRLPDAYYEELGALALAHDDAPGALEVAEHWRIVRGGDAPAGAIALRARARAAGGDARAATEALEKELLPLDPVLARDVAVELAGQLRSADPASALRLARSALADSPLPPLEPAREAAALAALADAAEATGDAVAAQAAFARLARDFASEPAAAGAAYRAARLAAAVPAAGQAAAPGAAAATRPAAKAPAEAVALDADPLSRRLAAAGQVYAEVVAGMGTKP